MLHKFEFLSENTNTHNKKAMLTMHINAFDVYFLGSISLKLIEKYMNQNVSRIIIALGNFLLTNIDIITLL